MALMKSARASRVLLINIFSFNRTIDQIDLPRGSKRDVWFG